MDGYAKTIASIESVRGDRFRSLHLQLCVQAIAMEFGLFIDQYCRKFPRMFLELYDENACGIREGLQSGMVDVCFSVGRAEDFLDISGRNVLHVYPSWAEK